MMNLLAYTKKLYEQVSYYDALAKKDYSANPFTQPVNITVIWIDEDE